LAIRRSEFPRDRTQSPRRAKEANSSKARDRTQSPRRAKEANSSKARDRTQSSWRAKEANSSKARAIEPNRRPRPAVASLARRHRETRAIEPNSSTPAELRKSLLELDLPHGATQRPTGGRA